MKVELVRIGNSRGIRIPKAFIEQCNFGNTVELRMERDRLIITPERPPRQGWEEAFQAAEAGTKDPVLLDLLPPNEFDGTEWQW